MCFETISSAVLLQFSDLFFRHPQAFPAKSNQGIGPRDLVTQVVDGNGFCLQGMEDFL